MSETSNPKVIQFRKYAAVVFTWGVSSTKTLKDIKQEISSWKRAAFWEGLTLEQFVENSVQWEEFRAGEGSSMRRKEWFGQSIMNGPQPQFPICLWNLWSRGGGRKIKNKEGSLEKVLLSLFLFLTALFKKYPILNSQQIKLIFPKLILVYLWW